jgi:hypothetical protein
MLGLSSAFFGQSKTDIQVMLMLTLYSSFLRCTPTMLLLIFANASPLFSGWSSCAEAGGQQRASIIRRKCPICCIIFM